MTLLYVTNNATIELGLLRNLNDKKKLLISSGSVKEKNNIVNCGKYVIEPTDKILTEIDILSIAEKNKNLYITSYELKTSKNNIPFKFKIQSQLLKQALLLLFSVMDNILLQQGNSCISIEENVENYIIEVRYLNGINENNLRNSNIKEKIDYLKKYSYLIYDIRIKDEGTLYLVDFRGALPNQIHYEYMRIEDNLKDLIPTISENIGKIVRQFLLRSIKNDKKSLSLSEIIDSFISQSSYQVREQ